MILKIAETAHEPTANRSQPRTVPLPLREPAGPPSRRRDRAQVPALQAHHARPVVGRRERWGRRPPPPVRARV